MIEKYEHKEDGYHPFLIRKGWQVAQLNHVKEHGFYDLCDMERHEHTDEVFILFEGSAMLIECTITDDLYNFEICKMERGIVYNIPQGVWHNISMSEDAKIFIVENNNTHLVDVEHMVLNRTRLDELTANIVQILG